jgi:hypothetical protein
MTPVLIYTDTNAIEDAQDTLNNIAPIFQNVYSALKAIGITPTLKEIQALVQKAKAGHDDNFVREYVLDKKVQAVTPFQVNGLTFTTQAVKIMIAMPDISLIIVALKDVWGSNSNQVFTGSIKDVRIDLLSIKDDTISIIEDAETKIKAIYTQYTKTEASSKLAIQLQAVCDSLNAVNVSNDGIYEKKMPFEARNPYGHRVIELPGIAISEDGFIINPTYITRFERVGNMHSA